MISIIREYIGTTYTVLQKYNYEMDEEVFNEETGFYVLRCRIPQFSFSEFNEEISVKTRGTAYLQIDTSSSYGEGDFLKYATDIRRSKGMFIEESIQTALNNK